MFDLLMFSFEKKLTSLITSSEIETIIFPKGGIKESFFDTGPSGSASEQQIVKNFNIQAVH